MAPVRRVTESDVIGLVEGIAVSGRPLIGGQKVVVPVSMNGEQLALKIVWLEEGDAMVPPDDATNTGPDTSEVLARARREVAILSQAGIPELVKLGSIPPSLGTVDGSPVLFYSEEWVEGMDLKSVIRTKGPLPLIEVVNLGIQMGRAIQWLADRQLIHRDIKPGNIIRKPDGAFVLLDLGMAFDLSDFSLTVPGVTVGTLPYLSPEQLDPQRKRNMDCRSDTYSLGVTMYEAATGTHPYYRNGMSSTDTILSIQSKMPPLPSEISIGFPGCLEIVVMRLLAKNPHLRYRSCAKMIEALENVKSELGKKT